MVDISKLKAGCVDASFFALYTPADMGEKEATGHALEMLSLVYDAVKEHEKDIALAFSPEEALINKEKGLVSIMIGMENGSPIRNSLSLLRKGHPHQVPQACDSGCPLHCSADNTGGSFLNDDSCSSFATALRGKHTCLQAKTC